MAKVSINARGCQVEVEDNNLGGRALAHLAQNHWELSRDPNWRPASQAFGFSGERSQPRDWLDTGLEGEGGYRRHH